MSRPPQRPRAAELRGDLPPAPLDARAIERLSKNPRCQRLAALTLVGSSPGKAMQHVFLQEMKEEQSKFALAKGKRFETVQTANGAARLLASLSEAGILGLGDVSVRNIQAETDHIRNKTAAIKRAMALTDEILLRKAKGDPTAPAIVLQASIGVPLGSDELAVVRPDILVTRQSEAMYRVGEIKSYAYLYHLTDKRDVGQAAAQMGVYGMALERRLEHLGSLHPVPTEGALVMVKPGSMQSIAKLQEISRDISTARRIIEIRPRTLADVAAAIGNRKTLDSQAAIMQLQPCYNGKCRSFCALHDICRGEASSIGNPAILGDEAEAMLGAAGTNIIRLSALFRGTAPSGQEEIELQQRLSRLESELRAAS